MSPTDAKLVFQRRLHSALWAAWADSLGFISELTDEAGLRRRLADRALMEPVEWNRRVGGKFGVTVRLPAGTYSDDTQLRLAVGRAIRPTGFDAEAFAKVELPIWTSYALGGGRASKAAASHISGASVPWFGNFFKGWTEAGGNGAAMRVQPHVWAAQEPGRIGPYLLEVISDTVITHGHPRALIGALLHAMALGYTLDRGQVPGPDEWLNAIDEFHQFPDIIRQHAELSMWCAAWERESEKSFDEAWKATLIEVVDMIPAVEEFIGIGGAAVGKQDMSALQGAYDSLIQKLDLRSPATRGSGTATVVAAHALAFAGVQNPLQVLRMTTAALGTDTDTIATMAAALLGSVTADEPPSRVADRDYIAAEALRLAAHSAGDPSQTGNFAYPDLLHWEAPRTQAGAMGLVGDKPAVAGLGVCENLALAGSARSFAWSWATLDFGQTILVKHRKELERLPDAQRPMMHSGVEVRGSLQSAQSDLVPDAMQQEIELAMPATTVPEGRARPKDRQRPAGGQDLNVDAMLEWLRLQGYTDQAVGYAVRRIAELGTVEQMIAFTATLQAEIKSRSA
ncbi:ADP-ribosylglycohydrolase family protein [Streptomyces sp. NPDC005752]|uniref:ADP-ribosylglycohydrolase family protein n=1 Tax=Streptomyces sp. NPDC005752 TaxID=3157065 RepID=UPI0033D3500C